MFQLKHPTAIRTFTGRDFDFEKPMASNIDIVDIAWALSNIQRFGGHAFGSCTVAEHSVAVSYLVSPENAFWGLMHDATEAYVGDIVAPLKQLLPEFSKYEEIAREAIFLRYRSHFIRREEPGEVKIADISHCMAEAKVYLNVVWEYPGVTPANFPIMGLKQIDAYNLFLRRFTELTGNEE